MTTNTAPRPLLIDSREAARMLGISTRTLYALTKAGKLSCIRPTVWSVRYAFADLQEFVDKQRAG